MCYPCYICIYIYRERETYNWLCRNIYIYIYICIYDVCIHTIYVYIYIYIYEYVFRHCTEVYCSWCHGRTLGTFTRLFFYKSTKSTRSTMLGAPRSTPTTRDFHPLDFYEKPTKHTMLGAPKSLQPSYGFLFTLIAVISCIISFLRTALAWTSEYMRIVADLTLGCSEPCFSSQSANTWNFLK